MKGVTVCLRHGKINRRHKEDFLYYKTLSAESIGGTFDEVTNGDEKEKGN